MLRFYVLGEFRAENAGCSHSVALELPALRKTQSLLAYLLVHRDRHHTREHLTGMFWGDFPAERARASLSTALKQLRAFLRDNDVAPDALDTDRLSVRLSLSSLWLDLAALERGLVLDDIPARAEALDLYAGDLLEGWSDEWCIEERERLRQRVLRAGTKLVRYYLEHLQWPAGVALAEKLLVRDPFDDTLHELLLRLLLGTGNYLEARRQYQRFAELLRNELGVDLAVAAQQVYADGMNKLRGGLDARTDRDSLDLHEAAAAMSPLPRHLPFVGRAVERRLIGEAISRLRGEDTGGVVLVRGEAGTGKTRLVDEAAAAAGTLRVARGRAYELGSNVPFAPLLAPLSRWLLEELAPQQVLSRLGATAAAALAQVLPTLAARLPGLRPLPPLPPREAQLRLLQSVVAGVLAGVAPRSPAVLILDDLQWADDATLQVLEQLWPQLAVSRLLVIGILRDEDVPQAGPLPGLVLAAERGGCPVIDLKPLSASEVRQLVEPRMPAEQASLSGWLFGWSSGNAFYIVELLRRLQEEHVVVQDAAVGGWRLNEGAALASLSSAVNVPTLGQAVLQRYATLTEAAQLLVRISSVMAEEVSFGLLMEVSSLPEDEALEALEETLARRFVRQHAGDDSYVVSHDIIRQTVYSSLSLPRRQGLHERVASAMEQILYRLEGAAAGSQPVGGSSASAGQLIMKVAHHYGQSADEEKQRVFFLRAAETAQANYQHEVAIGYYGRLIALLPPGERPEIMFKHAYLLYTIGRWQDSEAVCREALRLAEDAGATELIVRARLEISMQLRLRDAYEESLGEVRQARDLMRKLAAPDRRLVLKAHREAAATLYLLARYTEAAEQMQFGLELATELDDKDAQVKLLSRLGDIHTNLAEYDQALRYQEAAIEVARQLGDLSQVAWVTFAMGRCYRYTKEVEQAVSAILETLRLIEQTGYRGLLTAALSILGTSYAIYGDYERAYACAVYHLQEGLAAQRPYSFSFALNNIARAYLGLGLTAAAEQCWRRAIAVSQAVEVAEGREEYLSSLAELTACRGEYEQALELATEAATFAERVQDEENLLRLALLVILVRTKLGILEQEDGIAECQALLGKHQGDEERAAIFYTMWRIAPEEEEPGSRAADIYRDLYAARPTADYRTRYAELTGELLPDPPALPPPPVWIPAPPASLDALVAAVDEFVATYPAQ